MSCPTDAVLDDYAAGRLDLGARTPVEAHLTTCWECRETVAELGRASPPPSRQPARVAGRFSILNVLGEGGMGTVCAAYDPLLDRRVAIKFVALSNLAPDAQGRLQAEATALARVSHPCVVPVHDVLVENGSVLLVMEHVAGPTLDAWACQERPKLETLLDLLARCAQGLMAIHAAGLVHGDVKPANILVRPDGRPCIIDFGLARQAETQVAAGVPGGGTPAYMAPEQWDGQPATAATDQYSFCASVAQLVWGERPPVRDAATWVRQQGLAATGQNVPLHMATALAQGLDPKPAQRHASMAALAAALVVHPRQQQGVVWVGAVVAAVVVALGLYGNAVWSCRAATGELQDVLDGPSMAEAARRFGQGQDGPRAVWDAAARDLQHFSLQWHHTRSAVCASPGATPEQTACLHRSVLELEAFLGAAAPSPALADRGLQPLTHLSDPDACVEASRHVPVEPAARTAVEAVRDQLAAVDGLLAAGQSSKALAAAHQAAEVATRVGFPPLQKEAQERVGHAALASSNYPEAEQALWKATAGAFQEADMDGAQQLLAELMLLIGALEARPDAAAGVAQLAQSLVERTRNPRQAELVFRHLAGRVDRAASRNAQAETQQRRALELAASGTSLGRLHTWDLHNELGVLLLLQGRAQDARVELERVVVDLSQAQGAQHPLLCAARTNLGLALRRAGAANALEELEAAEALCLRTVGPAHARSWSAMNNVGDALLHAGRAKEAEGRFAACVDAATPVVGGDHPTVLVCTKGQGDALQAQGNHAAALRVYQETMPRLVARVGSDHASVASLRVAMSRSLLALGRGPEALELAQQGLEERVRNKRDIQATAEAQGAVALALRALGREPERSRELLDTAVTSLRTLGPSARHTLALLGQEP